MEHDREAAGCAPVECEHLGRHGSVAAWKQSRGDSGRFGHTALGTSAYHIALLIDTQHGRIGIEFYAPDDKEIGHKAIDNTDLFEERLGLAATPFDAKKASGLRFYKDGCKIKNNEAAWPRFISEQLEWALAMKKLIAELQL
ncbi:DUF4268 domain-containing protein [Senegalimassilia anaerobia]|uniref:DUF4268 domain-containing protein n=1 Tax=Senegalimassilia anaerobia TaxID=1473216 RepID=UPI0026EB96F8|nr:DUF4268 domain-containing protein [Senegalimassilia anaerobia]